MSLGTIILIALAIALLFVVICFVGCIVVLWTVFRAADNLAKRKGWK